MLQLFPIIILSLSALKIAKDKGRNVFLWPVLTFFVPPSFVVLWQLPVKGALGEIPNRNEWLKRFAIGFAIIVVSLTVSNVLTNVPVLRKFEAKLITLVVPGTLAEGDRILSSTIAISVPPDQLAAAFATAMIGSVLGLLIFKGQPGVTIKLFSLGFMTGLIGKFIKDVILTIFVIDKSAVGGWDLKLALINTVVCISLVYVYAILFLVVDKEENNNGGKELPRSALTSM